MRKYILFVTTLLICSCIHAKNTPLSKAKMKEVSEALIKRVVPAHAIFFQVEIIESDHGEDVFEVESSGSRIILRGNTPVEVASALNWYLKYYAHCQISWNGNNLNLPPKSLPTVPAKVKKHSPYKERVYLNYCTFSYTMPWWNWERWQQEIDWMAMHGINMPLAITGQEAVWLNTFRHFRMSDEEIRKFLVGPAYFAWQFMTNIEGWRGPLPQNWIDSHILLGQQILERERELGMTPILQGFTGYVPRQLSEKYPEANIKCQGDWYGVPPGPAQLDPLDPLFPEIGKVFMQEQEKLFGTNHLYAADPFHEGAPPVEGDKYLKDVGEIIYKTMLSVDPDSKVVMQTWSLREPIVKAIPEDKILLLALEGRGWEKASFWNRPWIAGVLHNYGGRVFLGGNLAHYGNNAPNLLSNPKAGKLEGIGIFTEATGQNVVVYDLAAEIAWTDRVLNLDQWLYDYQLGRYGQADTNVQEAWKILQHTVYAQNAITPSMESPICARPVLAFKKVSPNGDIKRDYEPAALWPAWKYLLQAAKAVKKTTTYQYDLVDVARQCLVDLALPMQKEVADAYESKNKARLEVATSKYLELLDDIDQLLGTREEFLLGKWLNDAKSWAKTPEEKRLYEANARNLITGWGPVIPEAVQYDYSNRQWSGLIKGFYKPRWAMFFDFLKAQKDDDTRYTEKGLKWSYGRPAAYANPFYSKLSDWEKNWIESTETYPGKPQGYPVAIAEKLYRKWNIFRTSSK